MSSKRESIARQIGACAFIVASCGLTAFSSIAAAQTGVPAIEYWGSSDSCSGTPNGSFIVFPNGNGGIRCLRMGERTGSIWSIRLNGTACVNNQDAGTAQEVCDFLIFN